jgi:cytochrome c oxidase subunit 2
MFKKRAFHTLTLVALAAVMVAGCKPSTSANMQGSVDANVNAMGNPNTDGVDMIQIDTGVDGSVSLDGDMIDSTSTPNKPDVKPTPVPTPTPAPAPADAVTISITAKNWEFLPSTVTVKKGQKVTLQVSSTDVTHGIAIPDFGVSANLAPGKTTTLSFVADKAGTFSFYCSVYCGSGHKGMKGTLIVTE